jgi:tRNA G10  N-methylase Trm11
MIQQFLYYIQRFFLGTFINSIEKTQRLLGRMGKQMKRLNDAHSQMQEDTTSIKQRIILLEERCTKLSAEATDINTHLNTYKNKFEALKCLDQNVDSIFTEIDNVKKYVCKCQNQLLENLATQETSFKKIIKNIEVNDRSISFRTLNGDIALLLTNNAITLGNWCFHVNGDTLAISNSGKNVLAINNTNPVMQVYKTEDSELGMSQVTTAEFFIHPDAQKKLQIVCENNAIPLHTQAKK